VIIERIENTEQFAALREDWNALLDASRSNCIFLTHEWLFTWWRHLAVGRELSIFIAKDGGKLAGVLPLVIRQPQYSRMIPKSLEFLGSGLIGSDYLDAIASPTAENEVVRSFTEHLTRLGLVLQLTAVRSGSSIVNGLGVQLRGIGWSITDEEINRCPYIDLRGQTWESFLTTLGSSQRYNFNRRLRNLQKNFDLQLDTARTVDAAHAALETIVDLHRKRWTAGEASEAFQDNPTIAFHREFVELAAARGWLRIVVMRIDGAPVAALYGLRYGETFYFYQSGFDPAWSRHSVGLVIMGLAIKGAIEEGASEYDFLHGSEEYKFHWTRQARGLGRIELYPSHSTGRISRRAVHFNRAMRRMARRMLLRAA
jgi:CelD/BcsL family acetyltransferase involved in cellulose biosynthesis